MSGGEEMQESLERNGIWWLPDKPERKVSGIFFYSPSEGIRVKLQDFLPDTYRFLGNCSIDLLLGTFTTTGEPVTLQDCFLTRLGRDSADPYGLAVLCARIAFIGVHFSKPSEICFRQISAQCPHLIEWLGFQAFRRIPEEEGLCIAYSPRSDLHIKIDEIEISISACVTEHWKFFRKIELTQESWLSVTYVKECDFKEIHNILWTFQKLLSLFLLTPLYPTALYGRVTDDKNSHPREIQVLYPLSSPLLPEKQKIIHEIHMLIPYRAIQQDIEAIFRKWWRVSQELSGVCGPYFGYMYNPHQYLEYQFLSLAIALEQYHRLRFNNCVLPKEDHKRKIEEILEAAPEEHRKWLQEKLIWSNEPSFKERVEEIIQTLRGSPELKTHCEKIVSDPEKFAKVVRETRNYFVHRTEPPKESRRKRICRGRKLYILCQKLKTIVEICLLREIGILDSVIADCLAKHISLTPTLQEQLP